MQTITKTYQVYKYEELSSDAQGKVRNFFGEDTENETYLLECDFNEQQNGEHPYFKDKKFQWSCSCCQGDGLSFSCSFNMESFIEKRFPKIKQSLKNILMDYVSVKITENKDHYYYAERYQVNYELNLPLNGHPTPTLEVAIDNIIDSVKYHYMDICADFYNQACNQYEYLYTDEHVQETCDANEHTFLADGTMFNE